MKKYFLRLVFSLSIIFTLNLATSHSNGDAKAGWGIAYAISRTAGADHDTANFLGNAGGMAVGAAAAFEGAELGLAIGSVGGPLGAAIGGLLGGL
tara:strand:- start:1058 stop:1342 length:285 start_codon:yes stop_codon:yes gene_type:complete